MNFYDYQKACARTGTRDIMASLEGNPQMGLSCGALGLAGESGEVADLIKKHLHHGQPLDRDKIRSELGDVLWYIGHLCNVLHFDIEDVANANIEKLRQRYPDGFTPEASVSRVDVKRVVSLVPSEDPNVEAAMFHGLNDYSERDE